jgi:hypothetical protein
VQTNIPLTVDQVLNVDAMLTVGAKAQVITVTEAPSDVDTNSAEMGRTIQPIEIVGLPLVNRNPFADLSLTPGVQANSFSPASNPNGTPNFVIGLPSADVQINGSIDGGNPEVSFYLDGGIGVSRYRPGGLSRLQVRPIRLPAARRSHQRLQPGQPEPAHSQSVLLNRRPHHRGRQPGSHPSGSTGHLLGVATY